jgi:hypothetical protein
MAAWTSRLRDNAPPAFFAAPVSRGAALVDAALVDDALVDAALVDAVLVDECSDQGASLRARASRAGAGSP